MQSPSYDAERGRREIIYICSIEVFNVRLKVNSSFRANNQLSKTRETDSPEDSGET